jgi:hypothetical protein
MQAVPGCQIRDRLVAHLIGSSATMALNSAENRQRVFMAGHPHSPRKWDHLRVQNSFDHLCHNNGINNGHELHRYEGILFSLMQRAPSIQLCLAFVFVGFVTE